MAYSKSLETDRLVIELFDPTNPAHYAHQLELVNSAYMKRVFNSSFTTTKEIIDRKCARHRPAREICTNLREGVEEPSHSLHLLFDKASGASVGTISFMHRKGTGFAADIGWGIHEEFGGKGYATEAARRVLRFWREEMGVKDVWAVTGRKNWASRKVCENIGLEDAGDCDVPMPDGKLSDGVAYMLPGMKKLEPGQVVDMQMGVGPVLPPKV